LPCGCVELCDSYESVSGSREVGWTRPVKVLSLIRTCKLTGATGLGMHGRGDQRDPEGPRGDPMSPQNLNGTAVTKAVRTFL
jgi:hypothetical protein